MVDKYGKGSKTICTVNRPPEGLPASVKIVHILGFIKDDALAKAIYEDFLPWAMSEGKYVLAPEPLVVGKGLEALQGAFEVVKQGVSAKKVVVTL